ncbi:MAG: hypothetical protein WD607_07030 [Candidatus Paceibacterota bacterium]
MPDLALLIKTSIGRPSLLWVLNSIKFNFKNYDYRIYISDENPLDDWKVDLYNKLTEEGHHIEVHEQGMRCGVARNLLVDHLNDEELILRMDDDFELGGEFNFEAMKEVLYVSDEIGFCSDFERQLGDNKGVKSGTIRPAGGEIIIKPSKIIKKFHSPFVQYKKTGGFRYKTAEFTRNLLLIKREVLEKVKWDGELVFKGEHLDFMLAIREANYKGAYTPDSIHYHRDDLGMYKTRGEGDTSDDDLNQKMYEKVYDDKWKTNYVTTKYPMSWYGVEGLRRISSKLY